jgi:poly(glycerol-phosphate) alpha-glucosyltransferase
MLDSWALNNSRIKKKFAGVAFENQHLRRADFIHALNASEAEAIRAVGLRNAIVTIPNGASLPEARASEPMDGARKMVFLGRLHPKKGLPAFIRAWSAVRESASFRGWTLSVAGWDQGQHEAELKALVAELGCGDAVEFVGPRFGEQKERFLREASAFVLPSQSEGLPMAVLEAWSMGLPTLITRQCNLPEAFSAGAAVELPLDQEGMQMVLERFVTASPAELRSIGESGRQLVAQKFTWPVIGRQMLHAYENILHSPSGNE